MSVYKVNGMTKFIRPAAVLLLSLFLWWNFGHAAIAAHAAEAVPVGTVLTGSGTESGFITVDLGIGVGKVTLYYELRNNAAAADNKGKEAYISGYSVSLEPVYVQNPASIQLNLTLPVQITHGEGGVTYDVVGIAAAAFKNFTYINSITIPNGYKVIGAEAFYGCTGLNGTINFADSVQQIDDRAFYGCSQINTVNIPPRVTLIGTGVFANCQNLQNIYVSTNNPNYCSKDGILYSRNMDQLIQYPAGLSYFQSNYSIMEVPAPVKTIYSQAFEGCTSLRVVSGMALTVSTIGEKAFYNCSNLAEVHVSDSVTQIGANAFTGCSPSLILYCSKANIYAENYAKSYGIRSSVTCTVKFYDGGTLLKTQEVQQGQSAIAPTNLEKAGYTLTWDKEFTNVQQNLNVYAQWKQNLTVTFKDAYSGQISQVATYYGGSVTPPDWRRQGYVLGWDDTTFNCVTKDMTVNAVWMISLTDGVIKEETPKVGDTRTINYITYQVTRSTKSDPRVRVVGCTKTTITKLVIPPTITFGGLKFKVTNIGVSACRDLPNLKTLEIGKNVVIIKKTAFYNCPKLKTITIHSKKLKTVEAKSFSKVYVKAKINVPNSYIKKYKTLLQDGGLSTYAKVY